MGKYTITPGIYLSLVLTGAMLLLQLTSNWTFPLLSQVSGKVASGEIWRIVTGNFVHFGWPHTLMNTAAFLLCSFALLARLSLLAFSLLLLWCCVVVGIGIYVLNPEYTTYAGLSGTIHGLIVAGLIQSRFHPMWIRVLALGLLAAKLIQEQSADYQATELQELLPVPVAVDAHFYGAIAGFIFVVLNWLFKHFERKK